VHAAAAAAAAAAAEVMTSVMDETCRADDIRYANTFLFKTTSCHQNEDS
jgi:hypothetical protein